MMVNFPGDPQATAIPLTVDERDRIGALLADVSTRSLLQSLDRLTQDRQDARLIIAALLDRFPED